MNKYLVFSKDPKFKINQKIQDLDNLIQGDKILDKIINDQTMTVVEINSDNEVTSIHTKYIKNGNLCKWNIHNCKGACYRSDLLLNGLNDCDLKVAQKLIKKNKFERLTDSILLRLFRLRSIDHYSLMNFLKQKKVSDRVLIELCSNEIYLKAVLELNYKISEEIWAKIKINYDKGFKSMIGYKQNDDMVFEAFKEEKPQTFQGLLFVLGFNKDHFDAYWNFSITNKLTLAIKTLFFNRPSRKKWQLNFITVSDLNLLGRDPWLFKILLGIGIFPDAVKLLIKEKNLTLIKIIKELGHFDENLIPILIIEESWESVNWLLDNNLLPIPILANFKLYQLVHLKLSPSLVIYFSPKIFGQNIDLLIPLLRRWMIRPLKLEPKMDILSCFLAWYPNSENSFLNLANVLFSNLPQPIWEEISDILIWEILEKIFL